MKTVIFNQDQIKALQDGRLSAWREPVDDKILGTVDIKGGNVAGSAYRIDDEVAVLEDFFPAMSWRRERGYEIKTLYKAKDVCKFWRDADKMPLERSRFKLKVTGVKVEQMKDSEILDLSLNAMVRISHLPNQHIEGVHKIMAKRWNAKYPDHPYDPDLDTFVYQFKKL